MLMLSFFAACSPQLEGAAPQHLFGTETDGGGDAAGENRAMLVRSAYVGDARARGGGTSPRSHHRTALLPLC